MNEGIAIVGMACRYPDAKTPGELWENVLARRRAFRRLPPERLRLEDALEMVEARLSEPAGAGQQPPGPSRLLQGWTDLGFGEKQRALRDAVARVTVTDGQVDVALRY